MSTAALFVLGASYLNENFISDMVDSISTPNDEYDSFIPFVMAEGDASVETTVTHTWKDKTY